MPLIDSRRGRIVQSARVRNAMGVTPSSAVNPMSMTSPMMDEMGPSTGLTVGGRLAATCCSFSVIICLAIYMSVDQSNSTYTSDSPIEEAERTRDTPVAPFMALSIGKVILASTSSGARPSTSAKIVTTGRSRSGKTSTDRVDKAYSPYAVRKTAHARTRSAWRKLRSMILFSMASSSPSTPPNWQLPCAALRGAALVRVASVAIAALSLLGRHRPHRIQFIPPAHHNAVPREEAVANLHVAVIFEAQHDALPDVGVAVLDEHKLLDPFGENSLQGDSQGVCRV